MENKNDVVPPPARGTAPFNSDAALIARDLAKASRYLAEAIHLISKNIDHLPGQGYTALNHPPVPNVPDQVTPQPNIAEPGDTGHLSTKLLSNVRLPGHFYIDLGNYCNLKCPFCPTGNGTTKQVRGFMALKDFKKIADEIRPFAKLVSLYNWGEPFLNKDIFDIIAEARKFAHVHIDSNFSFRDFTPAYAEQIVTSGLTTLFLSIDGATQETYQIYRVRGNLERVLNNIRAVQAAKARLNLQTPEMGWQFHVSRFNEHEMQMAADISEELGIPIVFKRLSAPEEWWSSLHWESDMVLLGGEWFNTTYAPPANPDIARVLFHENVNGPCKQLFGTMTIQWNGDVVPCTCVEGEEYTMGNVLRDGVAHVWNGEHFRKSRSFVLNYGPKQNGGSVCECLECPVTQKFLPN